MMGMCSRGEKLETMRIYRLFRDPRCDCDGCMDLGEWGIVKYCDFLVGFVLRRCNGKLDVE